MNIQEVEIKIKEYIERQLSSLSSTNPSIGFIKPFITRALDKKMSQVKGFLELIADESGNVDVTGILTEMITNVTESQPFTTNIPMLGDVEVGGGTIKISIPLVNKRMVINSADIINFKNYMTRK